MAILDLSGQPHDAAERLLYLSGVKQAVETELNEAYGETYAQLRREGRIEWAIEQGFHGKKRVLAMTRRWNREKAGRMVRWNDGIDRSSSAFRRERGSIGPDAG